jgi:hypothetical protein
MSIDSLQQLDMLYLPDGSAILAEVANNDDSWSQRSPQERETLTRLVHDYEVGEDWQEGDSWADVSFTKEEIIDFSRHILVEGDNGLPEWYSTPSAPFSTPDSSAR